MKNILKLAAIFTICVFSLTLFAACSKETGDEPPTLYAFDTGDAFTTNIKDSKKMLKCQVVFQLNDEKAVTEFTEQNYIVRDAVNKVLLGLTEDEVLNNADLDALGAKLTEAANAALNTTHFYSAKFTTFVAA